MDSGQDISGVVMREASNGLGPPEGTRVVALTDEFGWAEQVAVPTHRLVAIPDNVSFAQAATLPVAGLTALRCVRLGGALVGRRVLITGAAGGVGTLAVQIAAHSGAHVTAVVREPGREAGLIELGANEIIYGVERTDRPLFSDPGVRRWKLAVRSGKADRAERHGGRLR